MPFQSHLVNAGEGTPTAAKALAGVTPATL
jgi:hypothetical protein